jgi:hypothetical protein
MALSESRWSETLVFAPLATVCCVVICAAVISTVRVFIAPQPHDPFDAGQVAEAWRTTQGLPLYEDATTGHATHMYGALAPYALGLVFRVTGAKLWVARLLQLSSAIFIVALLAAVAVRKQRAPALLALITVTLLLSLDYASGGYFARMRPDMLALLLGLLALTWMYRAHAKLQLAHFIGATGLLIVAFFVKQTAAVLAAIPAMPILLDVRLPFRERVRWAAIPLLAVVATLAALAAVAPMVHYYMVRVPGQYRIDVVRLLEGPAELLLSFPLFLALVARAAWKLQRPSVSEPLKLWTVSALLVLLPACTIAFAKVGGTLNSWLPAMFAIVLFCALQLREVVPLLRDETQPAAGRQALGLALAALIALPNVKLYHNLGYIPYYKDYPEVISLGRRLPPGRLVSPEDPTISVLARGTASRSIYLEYDSAPAEDARPRRWPSELPSYLRREIAEADYVVDVKDWWVDLLKPAQLEAMGFEPLSELSHYTIWRRHSLTQR